MAMPDNLPFENAPDLQQEMQWALDDLLKGKEPSPKIWTTLPLGPAMEAFQALRNALPSGELGVQKAFKGLSNTDVYRWLKDLRNEPMPPRPGTEDEEKPKERTYQLHPLSYFKNKPKREWGIDQVVFDRGSSIFVG